MGKQPKSNVLEQGIIQINKAEGTIDQKVEKSFFPKRFAKKNSLSLQQFQLTNHVIVEQN